MVWIDGMGHDLPKELWDRVIAELTINFAGSGRTQSRHA